MNGRTALLTIVLGVLLGCSCGPAQAAGARGVSAGDHDVTLRVYSALNREFSGQSGDSVEIIVKTEQGEVTLTGTANELESIAKAGEIARLISGVKSVTNRMYIRLTY